MDLILAFLSGMLITNSIPHLVAGVIGQKHMTPLAKDSSALVNVVWGTVNLLMGAWVFNYSGGNLGEIFSFDSYSISFLAGVIFMALSAAWLFSNPKARFPWFK